MNEVGSTPLVTQVAAVKTASSKGVAAAADTAGRVKNAGDGNSLPAVRDDTTVTDSIEDRTESAREKRARGPVELKAAVADINRHVQKVSRDLQFSIDDDSGRTVIRVVDRASGELIRQIPEDIFLQLARNLKNDEPIHLVNAHG